MKSIISLVLFMLVQTCAFPQSTGLTFSHPSKFPYSFEQEEQISPFRQMPFPESIFHKRNSINKNIPVIPRIQRSLSKKALNSEPGRYKIAKITIDANQYYSYTYDPRGNILSEFREFKLNRSGIDSFRTTHKYDAAGNMLTTSIEKWQQGGWVKIYRYSYTNDKNGNRLLSLFEEFRSDRWINSSRNVCTYDNNGNMLTYRYDSWADGTWESEFRYTYTYNNNDNKTSQLVEYFHNNSWNPGYCYSYSYDNYGNLLAFVDEYWEDGIRKTSSRETCTYDAGGNVTMNFYEYWIQDAWVKQARNEYTYDSNGKMLSIHYDDWENGGWKNFARYTYTYDIKGCMTSWLWEDNVNGTWVNNSLSRLTYDNNGNAVKGESFRWKDSVWTVSYEPIVIYYNKGQDQIFCNCSVVEFEYVLVNSEDPSAPRESNLSQNYPNPFNSSTTIKYSLIKDGNVKISVFDVLGNRIAILADKYKSAGSYYVNFDGSRFPSGVYFYRMEFQGYSETKKFILLK